MNRDQLKRYLVKASIKLVTKTNGDRHRQVTLNIPKDFADDYPDGQQFFVTKTAEGSLVYILADQ